MPWSILSESYFWNLDPITINVDVDVPAEGGTFTINETNTGNWSVFSYPQWAVPSAFSGSGNITFNFTIDIYGEESRYGEILIYTEGVPVKIKITQAPLEIE